MGVARIPDSRRMMSLVVTLLCLLVPALSMDVGQNGVYDSPMATDFYVQRFGFLFGGGRSGMSGLEALQEQVWHQGEEDGGALTLDSGHEEGEEADEVQQVHGCALKSLIILKSEFEFPAEFLNTI